MEYIASINPLYILIAGGLIALLVYGVQRAEEEPKPTEFKNSEQKSTPFQGITLDVWTGVKFGFGLGIGFFLASVVAVIVSTALFGSMIVGLLAALSGM